VPLTGHVFLSCESDTRSLAETIAAFLVESGENVWMDDMINEHEETE